MGNVTSRNACPNVQVFTRRTDRGRIPKNASGLTFVCKNWNRLVEPLLYFNVDIRSFKQHQQFLNTVENSNKGDLVNKAECNYYFEDTLDREYYRVCKNTFDRLGQLQECGGSLNYVAIADALMQGKLSCLKFIGKPTRECFVELYQYAICIFLISDRLEHAYIFDHDETHEGPSADDSYDNNT